MIIAILSTFVVVTNCKGISVDLSLLQNIDSKMLVYNYSLLSHLDDLTTSTFKITLNEKARKLTKFLSDPESLENSFEGIGKTQREAKKLNEVKPSELNITEESLNLIKALTQERLRIPIALRPTDKDVERTLHFMDAAKKYIRRSKDINHLQIEIANQKMDIEEVSILSELRHRNLNWTKRIPKKWQNNLFQVDLDNLKHMLTKTLINPRHYGNENSSKEKTIVRKFLKNTLESFGLGVFLHEFSSVESESLYSEKIIGVNIIGVLPGTNWGSSLDKPIVIGAHYDTVANSTGTIDNGSGTASVIEAARILSLNRCTYGNSIFFVLFDLEEIGAQGSFMFVKDFMIKTLMPSLNISEFSAVFILDCVGNWNSSHGAQIVPDTWKNKIENYKAKMDLRNSTGDFIAMIFRQNSDHFIAERFQQIYNGLNAKEYRLELLPLKDLPRHRPPATVVIENMEFFRSDHTRFWFPRQDYPNISFPAVLITDTGPYRGKMEQCYHSSCDRSEIVKPDYKFMAKIIEALCRTTAQFSQMDCKKANNSITPKNSFPEIDRNENVASESNLSLTAIRNDTEKFTTFRNDTEKARFNKFIDILRRKLYELISNRILQNRTKYPFKSQLGKESFYYLFHKNILNTTHT